MTESIGAVFLSYASQDAEAAQRICDALRAGGIEVWFDQSELRGGDSWDRQIRKQIHGCGLFIPVISATTQGRLEGYFRREWRLAVDRTHDMADGKTFLVPVVIDDTKDQDAEVPESFRAVQWTRLPAGQAPAAFVERVARLLVPGKPQASAPARPPTAVRPGSLHVPDKPRRKFAPLLIAIVAAVAAGYFVLEKFVLSKGPPAGSQPAAAVGQAAAPGTGAAPEKSIAVLPFADMSQGKDQEYLSDGIAEELLNLLSKVPQLRVIARASSFSFKNKDIGVAEFARRLNVSNVLEGSVRKSGNKVRITVQLTRAADSSNLWSEDYDRTLDDIFKVQDEIAAAVVSKLKITLLGAAPTSKAIDPRAFQLFLQAKYLVDLRTPESRAQALELLKQALAIQSDDAPAWDLLARVYSNQALYKERPTADGFRLAREAATKALASDPAYAPAHARLGRIAAEFDGNLAAAAQHFQRALELDPGNLTVLANTEVFILNLGRMNEAIALDQYMAGHDPANPANFGALGDDYRFAGRWNESITAYRTALSLSPKYKFAHLNIGTVLLVGKGDAAGALKEMQAEPDEVARTQGLALAYHALGRKTEADAALALLIAKHEKQVSYNIAAVYAYRGAANRAFEWLDKAVGYQDTGLAAVFHEPLFGKIHDDARWLPFLRKLGKAPDQLAAIKFKMTLPK